MTTAPSDSLQRLLDEEPFVRLLAHTLLAEEADDVIQQTWLQALRHGDHAVAEPRSWLARILFNAAHDLRHRRQRRERHERNGASAVTFAPSPAELLEREESRSRLVEAVNGLPTHLRTAVLMRYFDGLPTRRIAARLDVPVTTVWNQLRRGLQLLRERLDAEHDGQRRAWLLPLIPFALGAPSAPPIMPHATEGAAQGITMAAKAKLTMAAALLLASIGAVTFWAAAGRVTEPEPLDHKAVSVSQHADAGPSGARGESMLEPTAAPSATATAALLSSLVVHLRHSDDKAAAAGVTILAMPEGEDPRVDAVRRRTDAGGEARFDGLPAGSFWVVSDRGDLGKRVELDGVKATVLDYDLPVGLTLTGIVVDRTGAPIGNALLELAPLGSTQFDAEIVATAGADGRFHLRSAATAVFLGARAPDHASSVLQLAAGQPGATVDLRLQLGGQAGTVSGVVVDAKGDAVPRAILRIGTGRTSLLGAAQGEPPVPATVHTGDEGRFVAVGIVPGTQPVLARAAAKAPWRGTCEITGGATTSLRIVLNDGATIRGTVRDAGGAVVARATVEFGDVHDLAYVYAETSSTGGFELRGLPSREVQLTAHHAEAGRSVRLVSPAAGGVSRCDLQLSPGLQLRGRVVDAAGAPLANARLDCLGAGGWFRRVQSDAAGGFVVSDCTAGARLSVTVSASGFEPTTRSDIDPMAGAVELRVERSRAASVKIRGAVVDSTGKALPNVSVRVDDGRIVSGPTGFTMTGPDGRFELPPVVPGTWRVLARSPLYPPFRSVSRELAANAVWDLEQITLVAAGTVAVRADGDLTSVRFVVVDAKGDIAGSFSIHGPTPLVSSPLAPGDYRLCVSAGNVTADAVPCTVKSGEQTVVALELLSGVVQRVEVVADALESPPDHVTLRVLRGDKLVTVATCSLRQGKHSVKELCLRPGDYRVAVFDVGRELAARALTVGSSPSPAVQIELR
ncbi:MAG: sigma-70 family RNA polymerase sigma factor [Planctomycetota bacterium]